MTRREMTWAKPVRCTFIWVLAGGLLTCLSWASASYACTSFILGDGDDVILGSNFDNSFKPGMLFVNKRNVRKSGLNPDGEMLAPTWTSKYGSVTVHTAPYQYPWAGMNEAGLTISTMQVPGTQVQSADERPALISAAWVQYVLDTCATIDEVIEAEKQVRLSYAVDHYLVCDASGDSLVIEFLAGQAVCHRGKDLPVKVLANGPYAQCVEDLRTAGRLPKDASSQSRMQRLDRMARAYKATPGTDGIDYAFSMLSEAALPSTTWSLVFDLKERALVFRTFENPHPRRVNLRVLDFSCQAPVRMIDMHAKLQGDITAQLAEYSFEAMARHARQAIQAHRPDLGEEVIQQFLAHVESFDCAGPGN